LSEQIEPTTETPLLEVENFSLSFQPNAPADLIDGISFSVQRGRTLCIVGESGCGKSVTSLALMGLLPMPPARIKAGTAKFEGKDLFSIDDHRSSKPDDHDGHHRRGEPLLPRAWPAAA
jgi:peptide/nickel transport system ATP-binding protein